MKKIERSQLGRFVGRWNTEGSVRATENAPAVKVCGTDTYEWLPGEFFLLHRVDVMMGNDRNETTEIIGYDKQKEACVMRYYDHKGDTGMMTAACYDEVWVFVSDTLRFNGGFKNNDMEFSGVWEQSADGSPWHPFMEIKLSRVV
jgi:hypothetical protein